MESVCKEMSPETRVKLEKAKELLRQGYSIWSICKIVRIASKTFYKYLNCDPELKQLYEKVKSGTQVGIPMSSDGLIHKVAKYAVATVLRFCGCKVFVEYELDGYGVADVYAKCSDMQKTLDCVSRHAFSFVPVPGICHTYDEIVAEVWVIPSDAVKAVEKFAKNPKAIHIDVLVSKYPKTDAEYEEFLKRLESKIKEVTKTNINTLCVYLRHFTSGEDALNTIYRIVDEALTQTTAKSIATQKKKPRTLLDWLEQIG